MKAHLLGKDGEIIGDVRYPPVTDCKYFYCILPKDMYTFRKRKREADNIFPIGYESLCFHRTLWTMAPYSDKDRVKKFRKHPFKPFDIYARASHKDPYHAISSITPIEWPVDYIESYGYTVHDYTNQKDVIPFYRDKDRNLITLYPKIEYGEPFKAFEDKYLYTVDQNTPDLIFFWGDVVYPPTYLDENGIMNLIDRIKYEVNPIVKEYFKAKRLSMEKTSILWRHDLNIDQNIERLKIIFEGEKK